MFRLIFASPFLAPLALCAALAGIAMPSAHAQDNAVVAKCLACHAVGPGAENKNGPALNGVAGNAAGSAASFAYSEGMRAEKAAGLIWTDENLDKYLADPSGFMPGTRMAWAVQDANERKAIIAYLKTLR